MVNGNEGSAPAVRSGTNPIEDLQADLRAFARDRGWEKYHTPRNLSALIASEAGELLALFRWGEDAVADRPEDVRHELADVFLGVLRFADVAAIDLVDAAREKLAVNARKYPAATHAVGADSLRVIAVDWSGAKNGANKHIWLAEAVDGRLTRLEAGRSREELASHLVAELERDPRMVVGLDFAFSFPAWFLEKLGLSSAPDLWRWAEEHAEERLAKCEPPFWGRPGKTRPDLPDHLRRADREVPSVGGTTPKSPFQIGGAGAVGTGTLRGLPVLAELSAAGFNVWPFDPPETPLIVEIYPRVLTGEVKKSNADARAEYMKIHYPELDDCWIDPIVGSEDAFDAAVSAMVMAENTTGFLNLSGRRDRQDALEGRIWLPDA